MANKVRSDDYYSTLSDRNEEEYEYEEYEDDYYDDYDDDYDDYEDYEYDEDEYYDDDVNEYYDNEYAIEKYNTGEYSFEDDYDYYDKPSIFRQIASRFARPVQVFVISLILVCIVFAAGWRAIDNSYFQPVDRDSRDMITVEIKRNSSISSIADKLVEKGIIRDTMVFKLYADMNDKGSKMRAGIYELSPSMTIPEVVEMLCSGEHTDNTSQFTLTEGKKADDLLEELGEKNLLRDKGDLVEIINTGKGFEEKYAFIQELLESDSEAEIAENPENGEQENSDEQNSLSEEDDYLDPGYSLNIERIPGKRRYLLEGYLFPDTYNVYSDATSSEIVQKMLNRFENIYNDNFYTRAEYLGMTTDDVITLASIIEKEALPKDFKKVSAVFHNRLTKKNADERRLQSCATLQYYLGTNRLVMTKGEEDIESPYNTYKYPGLPAGPICNPSRQAIEAALFPDEEFIREGYVFFCLTNPETGELLFSKSAEEHVAAKEYYTPLWEQHDAMQTDETQ